MRVRGGGMPIDISIEPYDPKPGYVEVRLRENVEPITFTDDDRVEYEYDEYLFHLKNETDLELKLRADLSNWLATGRSLEVNDGASLVHDMRVALQILGVTE